MADAAVASPSAGNGSAIPAPRLFESAPPPPPIEPVDPKTVREQIRRDDQEAIARGYSDPSRSVPDLNRGDGDKTKSGNEPPSSDASKIKFGDIELSADEAKALLAHKAQEDLRRTQIPADPSKYEVKLPADFKTPPGISFELLPEGPSIDALREWSHRNGLSQQQFSEVLALYGGRRFCLRGSNQQIRCCDACDSYPSDESEHRRKQHDIDKDLHLTLALGFVLRGSPTH